MEQELKQEFTRRISRSNKGELIVITYDICFVYIEDAKKAHEEGNYEVFLENVKKAKTTVLHLQESLDFSYEISEELYPLYQFVGEELTKSIYKNDLEPLENAKVVLMNLYQGFLEAAKKDTSEPLMLHTQQIVAGMTYQKGNLTETLQDPDTSRGFLA